MRSRSNPYASSAIAEAPDAPPRPAPLRPRKPAPRPPRSMADYLAGLGDESLRLLLQGLDASDAGIAAARRAWPAFVGSREFRNPRDAWAAFRQQLAAPESAPSRSNSPAVAAPSRSGACAPVPAPALTDAAALAALLVL